MNTYLTRAEYEALGFRFTREAAARLDAYHAQREATMELEPSNEQIMRELLPLPPSLDGNLRTTVPIVVTVDAANPASAELTVRFSDQQMTERVDIGNSVALTLVCDFAPAALISSLRPGPEPDTAPGEPDIEQMAQEFSDEARRRRLKAIGEVGPDGEPVGPPALGWDQLPDTERDAWRLAAALAAERGAR